MRFFKITLYNDIEVENGTVFYIPEGGDFKASFSHFTPDFNVLIIEFDPTVTSYDDILEKAGK